MRNIRIIRINGRTIIKKIFPTLPPQFIDDLCRSQTIRVAGRLSAIALLQKLVCLVFKRHRENGKAT